MVATGGGERPVGHRPCAAGRRRYGHCARLKLVHRGHRSMEKRGDSVMARTYREAAIEEMLQTIEGSMRRVINWWGDLPPPMKEAIAQFRTQLGEAIDSVEFVKKALDREI